MSDYDSAMEQFFSSEEASPIPRSNFCDDETSWFIDNEEDELIIASAPRPATGDINFSLYDGNKLVKKEQNEEQSLGQHHLLEGAHRNQHDFTSSSSSSDGAADRFEDSDGFSSDGGAGGSYGGNYSGDRMGMTRYPQPEGESSGHKKHPYKKAAAGGGGGGCCKCLGDTVCCCCRCCCCLIWIIVIVAIVGAALAIGLYFWNRNRGTGNKSSSFLQQPAPEMEQLLDSSRGVVYNLGSELIMALTGW
mmetsp:Transcript_17563/g.43840  ORF Transcript_17563/g.43840 Transcript_17563/m.43840 type:complete len:248 (-) Transcript_17563:763-1506(-)